MHYIHRAVRGRFVHQLGERQACFLLDAVGQQIDRRSELTRKSQAKCKGQQHATGQIVLLTRLSQFER